MNTIKVGVRAIELTNQDKVLFPRDNITKLIKNKILTKYGHSPDLLLIIWLIWIMANN